MMKKFLLILFFCLGCVTSSFAARNSDIRSLNENAILRRALNAPDSVSKNARQLTAYLIAPFDSNIDKMRVIAYWIASHIAYDSYKYSDGKVNKRNIQYNYDVFKARTGICSDFALLFQEMTQYAGIRGVKYVSGYVVETKRLKNHYSPRQLDNGHAWNSVRIDGQVYYIDTTFMAPQSVKVTGGNRANSLRHRFEIKKRSRSFNNNSVDKNIDNYYFLFTPQNEVREKQMHHFEDINQ